MINFNELPPDIRSHIFELTRNPVQSALISKDNETIVNEKAQFCFDTLVTHQDDAPPALKSAIAQIPKDSSISSLECIKRLYQVVKYAGYDDNRPFKSLQPEKIRNAFNELKKNQDDALVTILPRIATEDEARLPIPEIKDAEGARLWIAGNLSVISKIKKLMLNGFYLNVLPPEIGLLTNLTGLYLSVNDLTALPKEIGQLTQLRELYVDENKLKELPQEIGNLTNLKHIYAQNNSLNTLPSQIERLSKLEILNVSYNKLKTLLPGIGKLNKLEWLNLTCNELTTIPNEIGQLLELWNLSVDENPLIALPTELKNLNNLTKLIISENQQSLLPPLLPKCTTVQIEKNYV